MLADSIETQPEQGLTLNRGDFDPRGIPKGAKVCLWGDVLEEDIVVGTGVALRSV